MAHSTACETVAQHARGTHALGTISGTEVDGHEYPSRLRERGGIRTPFLERFRLLPAVSTTARWRRHLVVESARYSMQGRSRC